MLNRPACVHTHDLRPASSSSCVAICNPALQQRPERGAFRLNRQMACCNRQRSKSLLQGNLVIPAEDAVNQVPLNLAAFSGGQISMIAIYLGWAVAIAMVHPKWQASSYPFTLAITHRLAHTLFCRP